MEEKKESQNSQEQEKKQDTSIVEKRQLHESCLNPNKPNRQTPKPPGSNK